MSRALRSALQLAFLSDPNFVAPLSEDFVHFHKRNLSKSVWVSQLLSSFETEQRVCQETRSSRIEDLARPSPPAAQGHCDSSPSLTRPDPRIRPGRRDPPVHQRLCFPTAALATGATSCPARTQQPRLAFLPRPRPLRPPPRLWGTARPPHPAADTAPWLPRSPGVGRGVSLTPSQKTTPDCREN